MTIFWQLFESSRQS